MSLMEEKTQYGLLKGIYRLTRYPDGALKECTLVEPNTIETPYGVLMPQYEDDGLRRKFTHSLVFHPNGTLKSISLQEQTTFDTAQGKIPAELVTFHDNGAIHRVFPLNGKLSGYWDEKKEYELEPVLHFEVNGLQFDKKIIGISFYANGTVHSFTFWGQDFVKVELPFGVVDARIGLSFYESGAVRSLEPRLPTPVQSPVGELVAYDMEAIGVNGDLNSLGLHEDGSLASVTTHMNVVTVQKPDGGVETCAPTLHLSHYDDGVMRVDPLRIRFEDGKAIFPQGAFALADCGFTVDRFDPRGVKVSNDCEGCS